MARTSKTVIGKGSGEQSDRMMRAATSGQAAISDAQNRLQREQHFQQQQSAQTSRDVVGIFERGSQKKEQTRQFDVQSGQKDRQLDQAQDRTDLSAAQSGFKRGGESPGGARADQLTEDMARGAEQTGGGLIGPLEADMQKRLVEQGKKPMEMGSDGVWSPTKERQQEKATEQKTSAFKADTERIRAIAYRDQVGVSAQKALAAGDRESYKTLAKQLAQEPNDFQKRFDRLMKGDVRDHDWSDMAKAATGSEGADPTLMADIKEKNFSPRVMAFARSQVAKSTLESIVLSKGSTADLEIDWTGPKMIQFGDIRQANNSYMASNPVMQQVAFIRSTEDKMRFLNVLSAAQVLAGQTQAPGMPTPSTEAPPEAGGAMAPPPLIEQSEGTARPGAPGAGAEAITAARQSGATPQESLQAGQTAQPTAGQPKPGGGDFLQKMGGFGPK